MTKIKEKIALWFMISRQIYRPYIKNIILTVFVLILCQIGQTFTPLMGKLIFDKALVFQNDKLLFRLGIIWLIGILAVILLSYIASLRMSKIEISARIDLKTFLTRAYLIRFFFNGSSVVSKNGEMLSRILVDTGNYIAYSGLAPVINGIFAAITFCVISFITLKLDWVMASLCIFTSFITVAVQYKAPALLSEKNAEVSNTRAEVSGRLGNLLQAWKTVIRHNNIKQEINLIKSSFSHQATLEYSAQKASCGIALKSNAINNILPVGLIWLGAYRMFAGHITMGTLIAFCSYLPMMCQAVSSVIGATINIFVGLGQSSQLIKLLENYPPDVNTPIICNKKEGLKKLTFEDILIKVEPFTLQSKYLEFEKPNTYLVKGDSGAGKSILLEFLAGIRNPYSANILRNDKICSVEDYLSEAKSFSYLIKDEILFDRTVQDNIGYSLDIEQSGDGILEFATHLNIDDKLISSTQGLSEGEKQRICFLRELMRKPDIFIIDEGLDSVNSDKRLTMYELIRKVLPDSILIICTHNWQNHIPVDGTITITHGNVLQEKCELISST